MPQKNNNQINNDNLPTVVIFGRTNVGKSTLFNKLTESSQALASPVAGTTRDSNQAPVEWRGASFRLVDTGGILDEKIFEFCQQKKPKRPINKEEALIEDEVLGQALKYLKQADLILFLTDVKAGLLGPDKELADFLKEKKWDKKTILAVNKTDSPRLIPASAEFYKLNLGEPISISAASGLGTGDLLDEIIKRLKIKTALRPIDVFANVLIAGKPNVGKSSLLNKILGEKKVIVSALPHTTREPQDTFLNYEGKIIRLVDTAGISKKGLKQVRQQRTLKTLEAGGIRLSLKSLAQADVVLLIVDISQPLTAQDAKIVEEILAQQKNIIIVANKWDLIKERDQKKFKEYINYRLPFVAWAPILFVSALTGKGVKAILPAVIFEQIQRQQIIEDSKLDEFLQKITKIRKPTKGKGFKRPFIYSIRQTRSAPPQFEVVIGSKDNLAESYVRFIANQIREQFNFSGTPISIFVRKKRRKDKKVDKKLKVKQ